MIRIVRWWDHRSFHDARLPDAINETVGAQEGRVAWVRCSSIMSGSALVLYTGAPEGDGVFTGKALAVELEKSLLAAVEAA